MAHTSPPPGTNQTGHKAWVATAIAVACSFVLYWVSDEDPFTSKEIGLGIVLALGAGGVVGVPTYAIRNRPK